MLAHLYQGPRCPQDAGTGIQMLLPWSDPRGAVHSRIALSPCSKWWRSFAMRVKADPLQKWKLFCFFCPPLNRSNIPLATPFCSADPLCTDNGAKMSPKFTQPQLPWVWGGPWVAFSLPPKTGLKNTHCSNCLHEQKVLGGNVEGIWMMGQNLLCILHSTRRGIRLAAGSGGKSSGLDLETPTWDLPPYHSITACPWTIKSPLVPWFSHLHNGDDFYPEKPMPAENLAHSLGHRRPQPHASQTEQPPCCLGILLKCRFWLSRPGAAEILHL